MNDGEFTPAQLEALQNGLRALGLPVSTRPSKRRLQQISHLTDEELCGALKGMGATDPERIIVQTHFDLLTEETEHPGAAHVVVQVLVASMLGATS